MPEGTGEAIPIRIVKAPKPEVIRLRVERRTDQTDALADLHRLRVRFGGLSELRPVWQALEGVERDRKKLR